MMREAGITATTTTMAGSSSGSSTCSSSVIAKQVLGTQVAKTLCGNLYALWLSDETNAAEINLTIQELLETASQLAVKSSAAKATATGASNNNSSANGADRKSKTADSNGSATRHNDPGGALSTSAAGEISRGESPPPTSPAQKTGESTSAATEERTPSPAPPNSSSFSATRFPSGVDELDYPHRSVSPAVAPPSSQSKPVVDPSAPLPHVAGGSTSPHRIHPVAGPSVDTTLNAVMVAGDMAPPLDATLGLSLPTRELSARFVQTSGTFAISPPTNVTQASLADIPVFYSKKESYGLQVEKETEEMREFETLVDKSDVVKKTAWVFRDICAKVFKVPMWYKDALFKEIAARSGVDAAAQSLTVAQIRKVYTEVFAPLSVSRRIYDLICTHPKKEYITLSDLETIGTYLVASHPGLQFLQQPEFQNYYRRTVAVRIMYALERQQCRRIYWRDFDRSDLPDKMAELDSQDVNLALEYFSYEHFYVLYCKFWELDTDRDLLVGFEDLRSYGQGFVVTSALRRVVDGYGRPLSSGVPGKLDFEDFIYFCLSEEDKNSEPAVLYWFKVLDTDEDGVLSGYEMMQFFEENQQQFLEFSDSPEGDISYDDAMCQMLDMIGFDRVKTRRYGITLGDLRACPSPSNFFNMIFNAFKFLQYEHRDPFRQRQMKLWPEKTDWDRFAREEYDRMAAEVQ